MKIVFWGKGHRGASCLKKLVEAGYKIALVVTHPIDSSTDPTLLLASQLNIEVYSPEDPNAETTYSYLKQFSAELFVLAGYGKIIKNRIIHLPTLMTVNLHGGKLPEYRGSSPLNWVLINDEKSYTLSVIKVDSGVDTGDIILERTFKINNRSTIKDLHDVANAEFPEMLVEALKMIENGYFETALQDKAKGSYYPLRFPNDGFILWDLYTAKEVHNRIRALTEPYPCAYTYYLGKRVKLISSELTNIDYFGEAGRIYKISKKHGLLVCAKDKCLWIRKSIFTETGSILDESVKRYDSLATIRGIAHLIYEQGRLHDE